MNRKFLFFVLVLILATGALAQSESRTFSGNVGQSRIEMSLKRDGGRLTGTYSYVRVGKPLNLAGTIDESGSFTLTETTTAGAKTGVFAGSWTVSKSDGAGELTGEWKNPAGTKTLDFFLTEQMVFFKGGERLITKSFFEQNKAKMFEISVEYPELSGVAPAVASAFNSLSRTRAMEGVASFRKDMMALTAEDLKWTKESGMSNTSEVSYNVTYADNEVISVSFGNYYFTGGAHPNSVSFALTFDLKTGRELTLGDLFKPESKYLQVLSSYCVKQLQKELSDMTDDDWIKNGAGPNAENYKSWNLTKKGLIVNFDSYQVAAYAAGPQEVVVPYAELDAMFIKRFGVFNSE